MLTRREFSKLALTVGATAVASENAWPGVEPPGPAQQRIDQKCDLLIKGGTVIDPGQHLNGQLDVAVMDGKILEISKDISESRALKVFSAKDRIVTPGLIDIHVHCFDGFQGMNADHYCLGRGVTTAVDAGSTGYLGIDGFVKYIAIPSVTRLRALVNIAALGIFLTGGTNKRTGKDLSDTFMNSMDNPDWLYPQLTAKAAVENKPTVVGIKVRLGQHIQDERDLECLKFAVEAAEASQLPLMVHFDTPHSPLMEILKMMRKGDVLTHIYNSHPHGILDVNGKVLAEVREARERGVHFDLGHGNALLSFDVAEKCLQQGFLPDSLSTDLTNKNVDGPVYDLPTVISQMLAIGMDLEGAIERVTVKPAQAFDFGAQLGTLRVGNEADIAIFQIQNGNFEFIDGVHQRRTGHMTLANKAVVRRGQLFVNVI